MDITLLELHLSDSEFNAPLSNLRKTAEESSTKSSESSWSPRRLLGLIILSVALIGLAAIAKHRRSSTGTV